MFPAVIYGEPHRDLVFVSYRRDDTRHAARSLVEYLGQRIGNERVFFDLGQAPGTPVPQEIRSALDRTRVMLAVIGSNWLGAHDRESKQRRLDDPEDWVRVEVAAALAEPAIAVIPVLIDDADPLGEWAQLPAELRSLCDLNAHRVRSDYWAHDIGPLIDWVATISQSHDGQQRAADDSSERPSGGGDFGDLAGLFLLGIIVVGVVLGVREWRSGDALGGAHTTTVEIPALITGNCEYVVQLGAFETDVRVRAQARATKVLALDPALQPHLRIGRCDGLDPGVEALYVVSPTLADARNTCVALRRQLVELAAIDASYQEFTNTIELPHFGSPRITGNPTEPCE